MTAEPASTPLQDGWLDYQVMAKLPRQDTRAVRVARLAYYAGASHVLAIIAEHGDLDPSLIDLLVAELDVFIADVEGWRR